MAEEIIYDQITDTGDPDPLGLRKKLAASKQKSDPLGLRAKLSTVPEVDRTPSVPAIDFSKPLFKTIDTPIAPAKETVIETPDYTKDIYAADGTTTAITFPKERELEQKARKAQQEFLKELQSNPDIEEKMIRARRFQKHAASIPMPTSDMPKSGAQLTAERLVTPETNPRDLPVSPEEIAAEREGNMTYEDNARRLMSEIANSKPEKANKIKQLIYDIDVTNSIANDPNGKERIGKALKNSAAIEKGKLEYDVKTGQLYKPEGIVSSFLTGWKNKTQAFEDYDFLKNTENDAAIAEEMDNRRIDVDPDEPIPIPKGKIAKVSGMLGETPAKPIVGAGVATIFGGPLSGGVAGSVIGGRENAKLEYSNVFKQVYYELRDQGMDKYEAVRTARSQAEQAAEVGAIVGGATGALGARWGIRPLPKAALTPGLRQAATSILRKEGNEFSKTLLEGLAAGGIAAGGERYKNELAQTAGIDRPLDQGMSEQIEANLLFAAALGAAVKAGKGVSPKFYRTLLNGLKRSDDTKVGTTLNEWVEQGHITEQQAETAQKEITAYKESDGKIPQNVSEDARIEIQKKIKQRDGLEAKLETEDKAFHPETKEKIKAIEEEINELAKDKAKTAPEEKAARKVIETAIEDERLTSMMADIAKQDPEGFMKMVADQALGRTDDGSISNIPDADYAVRQEFGDEIVDKAIEMFPLEKPKESLISVIRPEEQKQVETITIKPKKIISSSAEDKIKYISEKTGIGFQKSRNTNSWYSSTDKKAIRISDHPSKFTERGAEQGKEAIDLNLEYYHPDAIIQLINETNPFANYNKGDKIIHSYEKIGEVTYLDSDYKKGYVEVETKDGRIVKYGMDKFLGKGYIEKPIQKKYPIPDEGNITSTTEDTAIGEAETLPVEEQTAAIGEENIPESAEATGTSSDEPNWTFAEKVDVPEMTGITHAKMDEMSRRLGFPEYEKGPETFVQWNEAAAKKIKEDANAIPDLINKMRKGDMPTPVEQRMMAMYVADLDAKLMKDPKNKAILDELNRAKNLSNIAGGRMVGQSLVARKELLPLEETLGDFYERQQETSKVGTLTEQQMDTNIKEFEGISAAEKSLQEKVAKLEAENIKLKAEQKVKETKATAGPKRTHTDYVKERKDIVESMREKLRKARGETSAVVVPYAKELIAIAPDVAKLVKSLVQEGIDNLPVLVDAVHKELKDFIEPITKDDVRALIAGQYAETKRPRTELSATLRDLKDEAAMIGKLQELEAGVEPKNEKLRIKRNQQIEELKKKIKEHDLTNLAGAKSRMKSEIAKIEDQLRRGDYAIPEKKEIKLDKEGIELKDKLIKLRKDREIRLAQEELANRSVLEKTGDILMIPARELRTIWSSFDYSMPMRQGVIPTAAELLTNPKATATRARDMVRASADEKFFDRYMYDLKNSPHYKLMEDSGVAITDPNNFTKKEEVFQSRYVEKIPVIGKYGIKGSERAAAYWLNNQRTALFLQGVKLMQENGRTFENSAQAYKNWGSVVNTLTGRGELIGQAKNAAGFLSAIFFSPKLMASRLAFFNPWFYNKIPKELKWKFAFDMAKFVAFGNAILGLSQLFGADAEYDPRSADFGKIKAGDTRWDLWGGFQQYIRLIASLGAGKKTASGEVINLWKKGKSGERPVVETLSTFGRSKTSPVISTLWDIAAGENIVGEPVTWKTEVAKMLPIIGRDIYEGAKREGITGVIKELPAIVGIGTQTYSRKTAPASGKKREKRKPNKRTSKTD